MNLNSDIEDIVYRMKGGSDSFAVATVVRTLSVTAAKPGAKAIINQDGQIVEGWIGGGCVRAAVVKAAVHAITDGEPRFVSVQPDEVLKESGIGVGEEVDGRWIASNMCPSKGSMELFIEPYLANPELIIAGNSPVAASICQLAGLFDFSVSLLGNIQTLGRDAGVRHYAQWTDVPVEHTHRYIVIATQGAGDLKSLAAALMLETKHIGFVGSHRKMKHLKDKLQTQLSDANSLDRIKGPAGLDIGSVTPHEIALSILAELVQIRRLSKPANLQPLTLTNS